MWKESTGHKKDKEKSKEINEFKKEKVRGHVPFLLYCQTLIMNSASMQQMFVLFLHNHWYKVRTHSVCQHVEKVCDV